MSINTSFESLHGRLLVGDEAAAEQVFRCFAHRLVALASSRLHPLIQVKAGPEDIVQSVFRSFFSRHRRGQFELHSWDDLWRVLTVLTVRKCCNRVAHYKAACRDVRREVNGLATDESDAAWPVTDREPTPAEAAQFAELIELLLRPFNDRERLMVRLSLDGLPPAEVAARLECSERKVYRVLKALRARLTSLGGGETDAA